MARKILLVNPWPNRNPGAASTKAKPLFKEIKMAKTKTKKAAKKAARPAPKAASHKTASHEAHRKSTVASYGKKVRPVGYFHGKTLTLAPYGKKYSHSSGVVVKNPVKKRKVHRNPGPVKAIANKNTLTTIGGLGLGFGGANWVSNRLATTSFVASRPWALRIKGLVMVAVSAFAVSRTKKDGFVRSLAYGVGVSGLVDALYQNLAASRQFLLPSMIVPVATTQGVDIERSTPRGAMLGAPIARTARGLGVDPTFADSMRGGSDV